MSNLIQKIAENKSQIIKKTLIVAGSVVGVALAATLLKPKEDDVEIEMIDGQLVISDSKPIDDSASAE